MTSEGFRYWVCTGICDYVAEQPTIQSANSDDDEDDVWYDCNTSADDDSDVTAVKCAAISTRGTNDPGTRTELQQLRHITITDAQRQSVSSFAVGLEILRKERSLLRLLPQVVTLVKLLCSSLLHSNAGTLLQSAKTNQKLYTVNYGPTKTEPCDGDRSPPWQN